MLYYLLPNNKITLSNEILPDIDIYSVAGETLLPAYIFHYIGNNSLPTDGSNFIEDCEYLKNNPAILNDINYILSEEASNYNNNIYSFPERKRQ